MCHFGYTNQVTFLEKKKHLFHMRLFIKNGQYLKLTTSKKTVLPFINKKIELIFNLLYFVVKILPKYLLNAGV